MDRNMRRIGDEVAGPIEERAGEIQPFLDVDRRGGVLQRHPHFLGDRHEQVRHDLEHDRIGLGARGGGGAGHGAGEDEVAERIDPRLPAGLDHGGGGGVDDQRGAGDVSPGERSPRS